MAYVSLYRKYRPQTFEDVVGQDHISTTLQNALRKGTVSSGYLFSGTRGTAKTTCARILAKALNCVGPDGNGDSPTPTPCSVCIPCKAIANSSFVDVVEMDAASHGKIDDVRDIVGSIMYPPMEGRYKVYIIDEAHQLSRDAMDAFLKTLEEPPPRVVFVLATTEVDKLPITIASRCQVFEFRRGSIPQISSRIKQVLENEEATCEDGVVTAIAKAAEGSYRDSLSLLEQVLAYKFTGITVKDVAAVLGSIDSETLDQIVALIANKNQPEAFAMASQVLNSGKDVRQFLRSLTSRLRELLLLCVGGPAGDDLSAEESAALQRQSNLFPSSALLQMIQCVVQAESDTRTNNQHQLILEVTLLQLIAILEKLTATQRMQPASVSETVHPSRATQPSPAATIPKPEQRESAFVSAEAQYRYPAEAVKEPIAEEFIDQPNDDLLTVQQVAGEPPVAAVRVPSADLPETLVRLQKSWQSVVNRMTLRSPAGAPLIKDAVPVALVGSTIHLKMSSTFNMARMSSNPKGRKIVEDVIAKVLDVPEETYTIKCVLHEPVVVRSSSAQTPISEPVQMPVAPLAQDNGLLEEVIAVFGGRVVDDE